MISRVAELWEREWWALLQELELDASHTPGKDVKIKLLLCKYGLEMPQNKQPPHEPEMLYLDTTESLSL